MSIENEATTAGDPSLTPQTTPADMSEEDREMMEAEEVARRAQYGQTGDMLDTTMGGLGGAGASGSGPDIGQQSSPAPGNHSDMPAGSR
jgi:hypothetical protein